MKKNIDTIIFDLGGVLIDWNPRYLYRKIFSTEEEVSWFLENICTSEWNDEQDGGRSFEEATRVLVEKHPDWRMPIEAWYNRWQETITGPVHGTVEILRALKESKTHRLYALTNWSAQSFPWALDNFEFLHWFEGIVVSGIERHRKPHKEIYEILFTRYNITPASALFIDDNHRNIDAAREFGLNTILFQSPDQLKFELSKMGL